MWESHGELPFDPQVLARIAEVQTCRWPALWERLQGFFTVSPDGRSISQKRITIEIDKACKRTASAQAETGQPCKRTPFAHKKSTNSAPNPLKNNEAAAPNNKREDIRERASALSARAREGQIRFSEWEDGGVLAGVEAAAEEAGLSKEETAVAFKRFADHARATGRLCVDWMAAWRNWISDPRSRAPPAARNVTPFPAQKRNHVREMFDALDEYTAAARRTDSQVAGRIAGGDG
jgi:uncharacterized protein YdaU (DUF1376 family)